jgi:hypothetical protein
MAIVDLAVGAVLGYGWGVFAALVYLTIGLPLLIFIYLRLDLLSVALAALGLALVRRGHERAGGISLALAVLTKVWPIALLPVLLIRARWRAARSFGVALLLGVLAWVAWAGWTGPMEVLTFRHAAGWEVGSLIGSLVHLFSSAPLVFQSGAVRVGVAPLWAKGLLGAGVVVLSSIVWSRAIRRPYTADGVAAVSAVAVLLVLSPILSEQYIIWLLPWAAIAAVHRERTLVALAFLLAVLTSAALVVPAKYWPGSYDAFVLARDTVVVAIAVTGMWRLSWRADRPIVIAGEDATITEVGTVEELASLRSLVSAYADGPAGPSAEA